MSPAPAALAAKGAGKDCPQVEGGPLLRPPGLIFQRDAHPDPRGETGRVERKGRRGGRVVEGARLESVFTGDRNAGSNPALSASIFPIALWILPPASGRVTPPLANAENRHSLTAGIRTGDYALMMVFSTSETC